MAQTRPVISDLCAVELMSALARKVRRAELERKDAERIRALFHSQIEGSYYTLVPVERHHFRLAQRWIGQFNAPLRSLDGLHLAVAATREITFATADKRLAACAEALGADLLFVGER